MATNYTHPGVYIQEIPSARSIQGASTSVAAFVGVTQRGPIAQPILITSWNAYVRQFGGLVWYGFVSWAVFEFFNEGGTACYVVRAADTGGGASATAVVGTLTATAATPGVWANSLRLLVADANTPPPDSKGQPAGPSPVFNVLLAVDAATIDAYDPSAGTDTALALFKSYVLLNGLARRTVGGAAVYVLESFNGFTEGSLEPDGALMQRVNGASTLVRVTTTGKGRPGNGMTAFSKGSATRFDLVNAVKTLARVQGVSLLAVPDTVTATDEGGKASPKQQASLINQTLAFCEGLQSLFYVSDPPYGLDVQAMLGFKIGAGSGANANTTALNSSFGAIYHPWVSILNPVSGANVPIPPSGPVLGRYAFTDLNVGVWKSPAGVTDGAMRTVNAVAAPVTDSDQDFLNPQGVNAIRNLIGYGNVIYGARTLSMNSEWTYVAVRRLFLYVEQSLKQSLQWVVFEPNDAQLWSAVDRDISAFLTTLWHQGGLFGASAAEAFFVTCDASNNPPETRALGQLFIDVGLAPVFPAEFVVIRITQKTAGPDAGA